MKPGPALAFLSTTGLCSVAFRGEGGHLKTLTIETAGVFIRLRISGRSDRLFAAPGAVPVWSTSEKLVGNSSGADRASAVSRAVYL